MIEPNPDFFKRFNMLLDSKQYKHALETAQNYLSYDPESALALRSVGQGYLFLNQFDAAEEYLTQSIVADPEDSFTYYLIAHVHHEKKQYKKAKKVLKEAIRLDPNNSNYWHLRAEIALVQQDKIKANCYARKALELDPEDADYANLVAMTDYYGDSFWEGIRRWKAQEEVLELDPSNAYVHNNVGVEYLNHELYEEAESFFRQALFLDPSNSVFKENLLIALRYRDPLYLLMRKPGELCERFLDYLNSNVIVLLFAFISNILFATLIAYLIAWILTWPAIKFYEYLTIYDIKAKATSRKRGYRSAFRSMMLRISAFVASVIPVPAVLVIGLGSTDAVRIVIFAVVIPIVFLIMIVGLWTAVRNRVISI